MDENEKKALSDVFLFFWEVFNGVADKRSKSFEWKKGKKTTKLNLINFNEAPASLRHESFREG